MDRRSVLRYSAVGLAALGGCLGSSTNDPTSDSESFVELSIERAEAEREEVSLSATVTEQASQNGPARLSITLRNEGSERSFFFGASPPFSHYWSKSPQNDTDMIAIPDNRQYVRARDAETIGALIPDKSTDTFWRATGSLIRLDISFEKVLNNGESLTEGYTLLSQHENEIDLQSGMYVFEGSGRSVSLTAN